MDTSRRILFLASLLFLPLSSLHAQDEYTLAQQGFLAKPGGQPVDSMLSMTFKLYKGGAQVWTETHPAVQVTAGNYEVALGSVTPFDTVTFDVPVELGIKIGADAEMNPRQPLRASPRALTLQNFRVNRVNVGPSGPTVNLIGGHELNTVGEGVAAATLSGGGTQSFPNQVNGSSGTVGGGHGNQANGERGTVAGGGNNVAQATISSVGGGAQNQVHGLAGSIGGGFDNYVLGDYGTVGGGWNNSATGEQAAIGGGRDNVASGARSTVAGGINNTAGGGWSSILGGSGNSATSSFSIVGGGSNNIALGPSAAVAGGSSNTAAGSSSFVGAGLNNMASGLYAGVLAGSSNIASGDRSAVFAGVQSTASGGYSAAGGWKAKALHSGSFVWADNSTTDSVFTTDNHQFLIRATGGVGIGDNAPQAPLHVTNQNIGLSASDVYQEDMILEAADAVIGLYSSPGDTWGSGINLIEMTSCGVLPCAPLPEFENMWSIVRTTSGGGDDLYFRFGTNTNYASNAGKIVMHDNGDLQVVGNLSKGGGSFKIDHPLDPQNKYLYHSFVESPDMMNVYNGNVILDDDGEAIIELPAYFEALNRDFRYQLTPIGAPAPNLYVASKISGNHFSISGGDPGLEVSWMITGVRNDPYAEMNRIQVEVEKTGDEIGRYLHPGAYRYDPAAAADGRGKSVR